MRDLTLVWMNIVAVHCSSADGEWRWSDSGYILEVKLTGFADGQDCGK